MELIHIDEELKQQQIDLSLAYLTFEGIYVKREKTLILKNYTSEIMRKVKCAYHLDSLKEDQIIRYYRDFYWHYLNIDPTKTRPSSEALIRRILADKPIPHISNIVDLNNWVSIQTKIPLGAYDLDCLNLPLTLRYAKEGEEFQPIGGKITYLKGNEIILSDLDNNIIHLYPHRDSNVTKITNKTKTMLVTACGVPNISDIGLKRALKIFKDLLGRISEIPIKSSKITLICS